MRLKLQELQESNSRAQNIKTVKLQKSLKKIDEILYYQGQPYVLKIFHSILISMYHNDPLADYFGVNKIRKLIGQ